MRTINNAIRKAILTESGDYRPSIRITLISGQIISLDETNILINGLSKEDAASSDESFSALGSVIMSGFDITIDNINGTYSNYDFENAIVVFEILVPDRSVTPVTTTAVKMGKYVVDHVTETDYTIQLSLLDFMVKFDKPYSDSQLVYPATLGEIVLDACQICGVPFITVDFYNKNLEVAVRPDDSRLTFRDVIGWVAAIGGYFAHVDDYGELAFSWFDLTAYNNMGSWVDNVYTLNPNYIGTVTYDNIEYMYGNGYHYIDSLYSKDIDVNRITITGIKIIVVDSDDVEHVYTAGTSDYVIEISDNPFITTSNAQSIALNLANKIVGLSFYRADISHPANFTIQQGDAAVIYDSRRDKLYPILVTRTVFSFSDAQTTVCGAESITKKQSARYSEISKAYSKSKSLVDKEKTSRELAIEQLEDRIEENGGLFTTIETVQGGGNVYYLHDQPLLADSSIVWKMTSEAWAVTTDYSGSSTVWNAGLTVDGVFIAQMLSTLALNFEWGVGGILTLGGQNDTNGRLRMLNSLSQQVGTWNKDGLTTKSLTADDYIYVDGNTNSSIKIPLGSDGRYIRMSSSGFLVHTPEDVNNSANLRLSPPDPISSAVTYDEPSGDSEYDHNDYIENPPTLRAYSGDTTANTYIRANGLSIDFSSINRYAFLTARELKFNSARDSNSNPDIDNETGSWSQLSRTRLKIMNGSSGSTLTSSGLTISGTKSRIVNTENYSRRLLYCYETASPMFGDVGEGIVSEDGICYIVIEKIFAQTITTSQYQVFLQAYGEGVIYVHERKSDHFIVKGTPGLKFGWELKAKQYDFDQLRLDADYTNFNTETLETNDYAGDAVLHIQQIQDERSV